MTCPSDFRRLCLAFAVLIAGAPAISNGAGHGAAAAADDEHPVEGPSGVLLGDFSFRDVRSLDGVVFRVDFELYAVVEGKERPLMVSELKRAKHRVRDQVSTAVRVAPLVDFQEPDLKRLRRRILLSLQRATPWLGVKELAFAGFAFYAD
ncbi:MAG: hypothetical protein ACRCT8_03995 [Lacipirellulaceae bacterium]